MHTQSPSSVTLAFSMTSVNPGVRELRFAFELMSNDLPTWYCSSAWRRLLGMLSVYTRQLLEYLLSKQPTRCTHHQ